MISLKEIHQIRKNVMRSSNGRLHPRFLFSIQSQLPIGYYKGVARLVNWYPFMSANIEFYDSHRTIIGMAFCNGSSKIPWCFNEREENWAGYSDGQRLYIMMCSK